MGKAVNNSIQCFWVRKTRGQNGDGELIVFPSKNFLPCIL
jgi:hypothetical protein